MSAMINASSKVSLNFELALESGDVIDSTFDEAPASFTMGDGSLLPGFEAVLIGMSSGDEGSFKIAPEDAFGQPNESNFQAIPKSAFPADEKLEVGLVMSFENGPEGELPGVIHTFEGDDVIVNFNHPLAGQTLGFKVAIIDVENA